MNNKIFQNSLFVGIAVTLLVGVVVISNTNMAFSQNESISNDIHLGLNENNTSYLNSTSSNHTGNWTEGNSTLQTNQ
ncbi:hypothetical protein [Candidatus Nitrosocosmicus franklandus]|uniref:Uncharacterized protein n=1 Tax=Candidatus Nitrosocosmicus franklandianus TaxID=1798806 RepID=A0A484IDC5_9ARCH|nr:hypothetical protein [Candidatus Nitrosocosmicus franklandus]VFJ15376.1 exported protein of unknown function [Candidatus Nitrosocosmicus franklandus]